MTRPASELDPESLDYGLDLKKEVCVCFCQRRTHALTWWGWPWNIVNPIGGEFGTAAAVAMQTTGQAERPADSLRDSKPASAQFDFLSHLNS